MIVLSRPSERSALFGRFPVEADTVFPDLVERDVFGGAYSGHIEKFSEGPAIVLDGLRGSSELDFEVLEEFFRKRPYRIGLSRRGAWCFHIRDGYGESIHRFMSAYPIFRDGAWRNGLSIRKNRDFFRAALTSADPKTMLFP